MPSLLSLSIETTGFDSAAHDIGKVALLMGNPQKAWGSMLVDIAEYFLGNIRLQFETGGGYQLGGFIPLTPEYEQEKIDSGFGAMPILVREGEYADSWFFDQVGDDAVKVFSTLENTKHLWHEFGEGNNKERPVLLLTDQDLLMVDTMFAANFDDNMFAIMVGGNL
jgi:hypothetical protein